MNMQFGFGGFNPFTGMGGMSGFNPYGGMGQSFSGYNPYSMMGGGMYGGMMGGFNPYSMGMYGGFNPYSMGMYGGYPMIDPSQFFNNYTFPPVQAAPTQETPKQETPATQAPTEQALATPQPFQFGQKFGINALQGKGFTQSGINQLQQAGIVQNKQQANQMLSDFQAANAGKDVTQAQFQDFARGYKPPAQTFAMPAAAPALPQGNLSTSNQIAGLPQQGNIAMNGRVTEFAQTPQQIIQSYKNPMAGAKAPQQIVANNASNIKTSSKGK